MEVLVLHDFEATEGDEMSVHIGDLVKNVTKATEEGWLQGDLKGKRGIFPASFVKEVPVYLIGGDQREPRSIRKPKTVKALTRKCEVAFAYSPVNEDELELVLGETIEVLREIEDGWWLGKKNGKLGAFPSNFVKEIFVAGKDFKHTEGKSRPKLSDALFTKEVKEQQRTSVRKKASSVKECCQVMFDYKAAAEDELDLKKGDIVTIITKESEDEGWWEGEVRGRRGFFPDNFVMVIPPSSLQPGAMNQPPERHGSQKHQVKAAVSPMDKAVGPDSTSHVPKVEVKEEKADTPGKPKLTALRKAPPPPVKDKPSKPVPSRTNGDAIPSSPKPAEDKSKEKDVSQFDGVDVSSVKLNHPTANRAKPPQRRPPTALHPPSSPTEPKDTELDISPKKLPGLAKSTENWVLSATQIEPAIQLPKVMPALKPVVPKPGPDAKAAPTTAQEEGGTMDELRAEVRELKMALDLLKARHEKDIEELKEELKEERTKRSALQGEIQLLRKSVIHH